MKLSDMLFANAMMGEGGGGGGGGDFSTATITITGGSSDTVDFMYPAPLEVNEFDDDCPAVACAYGDYIDAEGSKEITVVLYKGAALLQFTSPNAATLSGNCEYFYPNMAVLVTGDGGIAFQ